MTLPACSPETIARLVHDANQIGRFFSAQPRGEAAAGVANHLRSFLAPPLREALLAHLEAGGAGLEPVPREGVRLLGAHASPGQSQTRKAS